MQGSNYQIDKEPIMALPLIKTSKIEQKNLINLVDKILNTGQLKKTASSKRKENHLQNPFKQAKVKEYEKQIDQIVYKLYDLTPAEIKIIEQNTK